jgi:hypothetical protein
VIWLFAALAVVTTFVIAAVSVGSTTAGLASRPRRSVYDLEEAVDRVAEALPPEVTAEVSFDDVRAVLGWYLDYLVAKGMASSRTADVIRDELVVVPDDELVGWILGRVDEAASGEPGADLTDGQVVAILEANRGYERSIGAIGHEVDS